MFAPRDLLFLSRALEAIDEAFEVLDVEARFVFVNAAWRRMLGYSTEEVLGRTPAMLRSGLHDDEFYAAATRAFMSGRPWDGEVVSRKKDGQLLFAHVSTTPVRDENGELRYTVTVRRDLNAALSRTQTYSDRYAMAVMATRDGLSDWDMTTGSVYSSLRWKEIVGVDGRPEELGVRFFERVHDEDRDRVMLQLGEFLMGTDRFLSSEFRVVHGSGEVRHVDCRAIGLRDESGVPVRLVAIFADVTERRRAEEDLRHNATHDPLTGLANRGLFVEELRTAIGRARRIAGPAFGLLYIDLRHFKRINDAHGHSAGDVVLQSVAERLRRTVRPGDVVARLGGDEFAVLLAGACSTENVWIAAERVLRALEEPHNVDGQSLICAVTIGVALGDASSEVDQLVRAADTAMYDARRSDEQSVRFATQEAGERRRRNAKLVDALRRALDRAELHVAYQPILDMASLRVVGVEALARWDSPEFGSVSPAEFVPLAEQAQLAGRLGSLVLDRTLADLERWERQQVVGDRFRVHVNVSPRELLDLRLPGRLARVLEGGAVRPGRLCMEITETALVEHPDVVMGNIRRIKELGVEFALDDFGTGYSSLSHLRGFAVSSVKIDRSFVMQLPGDLVSRQIVRGLLTMTDALGLEVVAEGVEGPEHVARLRALGCRFAQGYHYARPMRADALLTWLLDKVS
jgi:diguanylate cyclase (GGDEF)-like protein/PAS domain S-box-containing protein